MVTVPSPSLAQKNGHQPDYDAQVRTYLLSMRAGAKLSERPECGSFWADLVTELEQLYQPGNAAAMERVFATYCRLHPALADLLRDAPPLARVEVISSEIGVPKLPASAQLPPELSRGACPPLDTFVAHSRKASPEAFDDIHAFNGLWGFSAVANRRIYLPVGESNLYPNIMIQYCGKSTFFAKSHTANVAKNMLRRAGLDFLLFTDRRMTPQKLLLEMTGQSELDGYNSLSEAEKEIVKLKVGFAGQKVLYYDEFGKMLKEVLGGRSGAMGLYESLFLELYGNPDTYSNGTVLRGMSPITNPFLSVFGSMVPANLRVIASKGAESWEDGLFARSGVICPRKEDIKDETLDFKRLETPPELVREVRAWHTRLQCPLIDIQVPTDDKGKDGRPLVSVLRPLPQHECILGEGVWDRYDIYRVAIRRMARSKAVPEDLAASYGRLPEQAMKFAMIMASLENHNHIELRHWARAQELAEVLRKNLHELYAQVNAPAEPAESKSLKIEEDISKTLERIGPLTVAKMRSSYFKNKYSSEELIKALRQMLQARTIKQFDTSHGTKYEFIPESEREDGTDDITVDDEV